ncbi:hypothetical protein H6F90_26080 [Trichocoleus sp. FACHB-591]|uniref:hypothetical protein n=1 Tax=Trichocoleus sp. FACHB-591 TaxID=2692872 RepID=UPI0016882AC7|nr:hypothetical protein [Trichocoleus sp. FACHB-591]MBD2098544.1 hypothetical protein [Trichocoleus sp. FACHB-591]
MASPTCSLSILAARTDVPFMMHTIPHLVRTCNFPFTQRLLAIDTAPLSGDKVGRPGIGSQEEVRANCDQLLKSGVVDTVSDIDYSEAYHNRVYAKHFGRRIRQTHNYKGYPILGTLFKIEEAKTDYVLHFDSDMMLYQAPGYSWIEEGMELIQKHPEIMAIRPLAGPPTMDGSLYQQVPYERDPNGFYRFKFFSSRAYLINVKRFEELLPLPILWRSYRNNVLNQLPNTVKTTLNYFTGKNALDSWEIMVSKRIENTTYVRAVIDSPKAWTVHPKDRGPEFIAALPQLIEKIEAGWYPPEQAGHYDLQFKAWLS